MASVRINIDPTDKILLKRNLEKDGKAQRFFTSEVRRLSDEYVPLDSTTLKSNVIMGAHSITYNSPYANYQYKGISKNGAQLRYEGAPIRGKEWVRRCWADRSEDIIQAIADFVGGQSE